MAVKINAFQKIILYTKLKCKNKKPTHLELLWDDRASMRCTDRWWILMLMMTHSSGWCEMVCYKFLGDNPQDSVDFRLSSFTQNFVQKFMRIVWFAGIVCIQAFVQTGSCCFCIFLAWSISKRGFAMRGISRITCSCRILKTLITVVHIKWGGCETLSQWWTSSTTTTNEGQCADFDFYLAQNKIQQQNITKGLGKSERARTIKRASATKSEISTNWINARKEGSRFCCCWQFANKIYFEYF